MSQAPGIITEILRKVNYCEFCDKPSTSENVCEVYTIEKFEACDLADISKNIVILCPACKQNYDRGVFSKKHLKACVMLRDPELIEWLINLFERYDLRFKQSVAKQGFIARTLHKLANDKNFIDNALFLFSVFVIITGIFIFSYGFNNVSNYDTTAALGAAGDPGQYSPEFLFNLFLELGGVLFALIGLFFVLKMTGSKAKKNFIG
jgi:hypothetical protein